jgi:hypothetical protein
MVDVENLNIVTRGGAKKNGGLLGSDIVVPKRVSTLRGVKFQNGWRTLHGVRYRSPDISSPSTAFKEMNAQWRGSASSQRGSARKNGGQWRSVRKGSKITPFTGFKGTKRQHFISDIHKSSRSPMETPPET